MPKRRQSGDPRVIWGAQLAFCRERVGLTQGQLADLIPYSLDSIRSAETGRRTPTPDLATHCDGALSTGGALLYLYDDLRDLSAQADHPSWFGPWLNIEKQANKLRTYQPLVLPGLLQTQAYARALLRAGRPFDTDEQIDAMVAARMERQTLLDSSLRLLVILDEAILHRAVGGPDIMAEQIERLIEVSTRKNITLQLLPLSIGEHAGLQGAFVIACLPAGPDVVYRDSIEEGEVIDSPQFVATITGLWENIQADALPQRASLEIMRSWAERWKNS